MIKRFTFATRPPGTEPAAFATSWGEELAAVAAAAPPAVRPSRLAVCRALPEVEPGPPHDAIGLEWFGDLDHLHRFDGWLASPAGARVAPRRAAAIDTARSPVVVAEEVVLRGDDWLERRWVDGGPKVKHMALARRAPGLSPAEFSARWRARAGTVGRPGAAGAGNIPPEARGLAYAQDHPLAAVHGEAGPVYDAVNEVWFDDVGALAVRVEWFAEHMGAGAEDDLVGEHRFLAVEEQLVAVDRAGVTE